MYSISFNYKLNVNYLGLILHYYPVETREKSNKTLWVLGICADFSVKDELKEFCNRRGGTWCPHPGKFWWIPLELKWDKQAEHKEAIAAIWSACKDVIDHFGEHIRMGGQINLSIEADSLKKGEEFIQKKLLEQVEAENNRLLLEKKWSEMPKLFNIKWVSDIDEDCAHEYRGDEGHYEGDVHLSNGKIQKVEVCKDKEPSQTEVDDQKRIHGGYADYRHILAEDGNKYWCKPAFTGERYDFGFWNDIDFSKEFALNAIAVDEVVLDSYEPPKPKVVEIKPDMMIKLVLNKQKEPLAFRVVFENDAGFGLLPLFKRLISERVYGNKYWDVPLECAGELKEFVERYSGKRYTASSVYTIEISSSAQQLLN